MFAEMASASDSLARMALVAAKTSNAGTILRPENAMPIGRKPCESRYIGLSESLRRDRAGRIECRDASPPCLPDCVRRGRRDRSLPAAAERGAAAVCGAEGAAR